MMRVQITSADYWQHSCVTETSINEEARSSTLGGLSQMFDSDPLRVLSILQQQFDSWRLRLSRSELQ
jgi:hypothetical protein